MLTPASYHSLIGVHSLFSAKGLFKLPYEVLEMVFFHIDEATDLIAFLMSNRTLYGIGYNYVQQWLCDTVACSCGNRIICLGDNCYSDEGLPSGILAEDLEQMTAWNEGGHRDSEDEDTPTYGSFAIETFSEVIPNFLANLRRDKQLRPSNRGWSGEWYDAFRDVIEVEYPSEKKWVLCNLTKREYVTAEAIEERTGYGSQGPFSSAPINLTEILMFWVCYSKDPGTSIAYPGLHEGPWAADRIEITTMDRLPLLKTVKGGVEKDWEDVSKEVISKLIEVARVEFPNRWEEVVCIPE